MKPKTSGGFSRARSSKPLRGEEGPNWVLIAGGALLSTLSIRLGYKLKQAIDTKQHDSPNNVSKGNGKFSDQRNSAACRMHPNVYSFTEDDADCFDCLSGNRVSMDVRCNSDGPMQAESNGSLPLVTVPGSDFNKENGVIWASSPDRLELPPKPFNHHSNCSDSPCVSESGSDVFTKREVIHKLRQQLKRRDDMILELQSALNAQLAHSARLESQLDSANRELFDSEREIQRLRKAIADHCVGEVHSSEKSSSAPIWPSEGVNGNGRCEGESDFGIPEIGRVEMLKREVGELKEVIDGKDYLLQSYKEQKAELSVKIKELQRRLDSQLPNIL